MSVDSLDSFDSFASDLSGSISNAGNEKSSLEPIKLQRLRMEYKLLREFSTVEEFNTYWSGAKKGWKKKSSKPRVNGEVVEDYW